MFDEFLSEKTHTQLVNFNVTRNFRIQCYLMKMFLSHNENSLLLPKMVLIKEMSRDYTKFMNFLMALIYSVMF